MTSNLAEKKCKPCQDGEDPITGEALDQYMDSLGPGWKVVDGNRLEKTYTFDDFADALAFVDRLGEVAEEEGHHPNIQLSYGQVVVQQWTHKIGGLSESDFILAAKADKVR